MVWIYKGRILIIMEMIKEKTLTRAMQALQITLINLTWINLKK